jgi:FdhD protein
MTEKRRISLLSLKPGPAVAEIDDEVALDEPVRIFVNGDYHATIIATPAMKEELAVGFLYSEGVIGSADEIREISLRGEDVLIDLRGEVDLREASVGVTNLILTSCGSGARSRSQYSLPRVESDLRVEAGRVIGMCGELNRLSLVHRATGGTHAAMICSADGGVQAFAEDVGRHNAVDKVIGSMILRGLPSGGCVLLCTGRLSGEMVQKAGRAGIPVVASMTVPLASGIRLAEETGLTLASLWRGRLKVHVNPQRISLP